MKRRAQTIGLFGALGVCTCIIACIFRPKKDKTLSPSYFTPALLTSIQTCGPDTKLLTLTVPSQYIPRPFLSKPIWSVFIKDDDIQVERPYTPLRGIDDNGRMMFWIKKYSKGEVGRWLHSKNVGDTIELRGPSQTWNWQDDMWDEVIMISGGTGITPFYQLFNSVIVRERSPRTRFTLLHSSRRPAELPPWTILQPLMTYATEQPDRFRLQLFVDSADDSFREKCKLQRGRIGKTAIKRSLRKPSTTPHRILFLVCGPEPMVNAISGPLHRHFSQGTVGGMLGEMGYSSSQVWKL